MKATHIFYSGLAIDAMLFLLSISNILAMKRPIEGLTTTPAEGLPMSMLGRLLIWLIPLLLVGLMAIAFWLKKTGKLLPANILLWIPAAPMLIVVMIWGGLAVVFIIGGSNK